jgi:hypothetical protein
MEIKHIIKPSADEVKNLFNVIKIPATIVYPSVALQEAAIDATMVEFESLLTSYVMEAFELGKKMAKADMKDREMYSA